MGAILEELDCINVRYFMCIPRTSDMRARARERLRRELDEDVRRLRHRHAIVTSREIM